MSDFKSMLPDLKELGDMTGKLFKDIKTSICEIISDYKEKHPQTEQSKEKTEKKSEQKVNVETDVPKQEKPAAKNKATKEAKPSKKS